MTIRSICGNDPPFQQFRRRMRGARRFGADSRKAAKDAFSMAHGAQPKPAIARRSSGLSGRVRLPGEAATSCLSILLGALACGETRISGLAESDDVLRAAAAMERMGARFRRSPERWIIDGAGNGCLLQPEKPLDFGSAGLARLLAMGLVGTYDFETVFVGTAPLSDPPMSEVLDALRDMGTQIRTADGEGSSVTLRGPKTANAVRRHISKTSAPAKAAVLLAGLNAPGLTTIVESTPDSKDLEQLLQLFGADLTIETDGSGAHVTHLRGRGRLTGQVIDIPGDPSVAAFPLVAALLVPGSDVTICNVLMNPASAGLVLTLSEMGATIEIRERRTSRGQDIADLRARSSTLRGVTVPRERTASLGGAYPALAVAAAFAEGVTIMIDAAAARSEEPYRLAAIINGLRLNGTACEESGAALVIQGRPGGEGLGRPALAPVQTCLDAGVAMAFVIMGLASEHPVCIDDTTTIAATFPAFMDLMTNMGANIETPESETV